jgi:hypothetical protein
MATAPPDDALPLERLLADLGFDTRESQALALDVLAAAGLTRPGKRNISAAKRPAVEAALTTLLVRCCSDERCRAWAAADPARRGAVTVTPAACELCGGSNNRRAARLLLATCERRPVRRILIVGGSPSTAVELRELLPGLEVRVVEGTNRPDESRALADRGWSDVVVVWATTILDHKLSTLYTKNGPSLTVARRGVEALCDELRIHLGG